MEKETKLSAVVLGDLGAVRPRRAGVAASVVQLPLVTVRSGERWRGCDSSCSRALISACRREHGLRFRASCGRSSRLGRGTLRSALLRVRRRGRSSPGQRHLNSSPRCTAPRCFGGQRFCGGWRQLLVKSAKKAASGWSDLCGLLQLSFCINLTCSSLPETCVTHEHRHGDSLACAKW